MKANKRGWAWYISKVGALFPFNCLVIKWKWVIKATTKYLSLPLIMIKASAIIFFRVEPKRNGFRDRTEGGWVLFLDKRSELLIRRPTAAYSNWILLEMYSNDIGKRKRIVKTIFLNCCRRKEAIVLWHWREEVRSFSRWI